MPITSAVFDRGGYQLHDTAGETIAIPYTANSLCALKFARSDTGGMYMVNEGCAPVLYVPAHSGLESATVPRARWYPFSHGYTPTHPVYMSVAPSASSYDRMGWYPGMACYGGYESDNYVDSGSSFGIDIGLIFLIGGHHYDGWAPYYAYYGHHHTDYHMAYHDQQFYGWAGRPSPGRSFIGNRHMWAHRSLSGDRQYRAAGAFSGAQAHSFHGANVRAVVHNPSSARVFRGAGPAFHGKTVRTVAHGSGARTIRTAGRSFHGTNARAIGHNQAGARSYRTATRSVGHASMRAAEHNATGAREFRTENRSMGHESFRAAEHSSGAQAMRGSSHQSGGDRQNGDDRRQSNGGGRQEEGGGRPSGGGHGGGGGGDRRQDNGSGHGGDRR